jgi:hypothetical protein
VQPLVFRDSTPTCLAVGLAFGGKCHQDEHRCCKATPATNANNPPMQYEFSLCLDSTRPSRLVFRVGQQEYQLTPVTMWLTAISNLTANHTN